MNDKALQIIRDDSSLESYSAALVDRYNRYEALLKKIEDDFGSLVNFAGGYRYFGFNVGKDEKSRKGVWYREWAPEALGLFLTGDFNQWSRFSHPLKKDEFGVWSVFLPGDELNDGSRIKVHVAGKKHTLDRIPAYIRRVMPDDHGEHNFVGVYRKPGKFLWKHKSPKSTESLRIYESHVGIAQERYGVGSFEEFTHNVLPRVKKLGYNAIQLMAVAEHPYYASFGYQVSNFFAVSHRFGENDELKKLIDSAHGMGIRVLMDLVHSHAISNLNEGLDQFDGSEYQYFHPGQKGEHSAWGTKLFNYGKTEVLRFLLSNVAYWMEEYRFDGFRFDGVTSMLYTHHGEGTSFNHYDRYFNSDEIDADAITYLQLANTLVKQINPQAITIAEDVSGMPGIARPVVDGGIGFDYRLAMALPDYWIKTLKHRSDESWSMNELFHEMTNRRSGEKHVAYAESHDQALVGDKSIAFWLMDQNMYWHMHKDDQHPVIDRGLALHKMIRLVTMALGGEGYLNFMGNEFGHPEWIDFPREGNSNSFHYARRQWSLVDSKELKYQYLNNFDQSIQKLEAKYGFLSHREIIPIIRDDERKLLVFSRGPLIFAFNFHPENSYPDLPIGIPEGFSINSDHLMLALDSDKEGFGGFDRTNSNTRLPIISEKIGGFVKSAKLYLPARTCQIIEAASPARI